MPSRYDHDVHEYHIAPDDALFAYLKLSSSIEMNVDGSSAKSFDYVATGRMAIERVNFNTVDDVKWDADGFFSLSVLSNGLLIQVVDTNGTTVLQHFGTNDAPIKRHADLYSLAGIDVSDDTTGGTSSSGVRWTIEKAGLAIELIEDQRFRVVVQDDLQGFVQFRVMIQGYKLP